MDFGQFGAEFSVCKRYRYRLWRQWNPIGTVLAYCMLNPSTADELRNDPTVERCCRRARMWGHAGIIVVNAFAWRSTDPHGLYTCDEPIGEFNDGAIRWATLNSAMVICGWGAHANKIGRRGDHVQDLIHTTKPGHARALHVNRDGSPKHPLYVSYQKNVVAF